MHPLLQQTVRLSLIELPLTRFVFMTNIPEAPSNPPGSVNSFHGKFSSEEVLSLAELSPAGRKLRARACDDHENDARVYRLIAR